MRKGRKQKLKTGYEYDLLYAKHYYCFMKNNNNTVRYIKRTLNRRWRKELQEDMQDELLLSVQQD